MPGMGPKDAFGEGNGLSHDFGLAMGKEKVTPAMFTQAVGDPIRRVSVGAALRGEAEPSIGFEHVLEREVKLMTAWCELAGLPFMGESVINRALQQVAGQRGITRHDRFIPGGLGFSELFNFFYRFNTVQEAEHKPTLKLGYEAQREWWRKDKNVQHIATKTGVFTWNPTDTMRATDLAGRPFYLNADEQDKWAIERGGNGLSTAEQITFLFQRNLIETGLPMWGLGSIRARNTCGSGNSLYVSFDADDGFRLFSWTRSDRCWYLGALPEVFLNLGA